MKRIITALLTIIMLCGLITVPISAATNVVIIDNGDSGYKESNTTFSAGTGGAGADGMHRVGRGSVTYTPQLDIGIYQVSMYIPYPGSNNGTGIYVEVHHAKGVERIDIDMQATTSAGWMNLGEYAFIGDGKGHVLLNSSNSWIRADCMKWEFVADYNPAAINITDIEESKYKQDIKKMIAFGVMSADEKDEFHPDEYVTRGEMVSMVAKLGGFATEAEQLSGITPFYDVNPKSEYSGAINKLYNIGWISGSGDGTFRPNDFISYEEASRILICMIGYDIKAVGSGGYYIGYLKTAQDLKLMKGITSTSDYITRETAARLFGNVLEIPCLDMDSIKGDSVIYKPNETLLKQVYNAEIVEGVVMANEYTSIDGYGETGEEKYIRVGNIKAKDVIGNLGIQLGVYINAYISEDENTGKKSVIYYEVDKNNTSLQINSNDIIDTQLYEISYADGERKRVANIDTTAYVMYNGCQIRNYTADILKPQHGHVRIVDNDGDKKYDFIEVWDLQYDVVDVYDMTAGYARLKSGSEIELLSENDSFRSQIISDGEHAKTGAIKIGSVVAYAVEGDLKTVFTNYKVVEGVLESISEEEAIIDGEIYPVASSANTSGVSIGMVGTFYFDYQQKLAYGEVAAGNMTEQYAYLLDVRHIPDDDTLRLKFLYQNGTVGKEYVEKINIDGLKTDIAVAAGSLTPNQLVRIRKNSKGLTTKIYTTAGGEDELKLNYQNESIRYCAQEWNSFASKYIIAADTPVFQVPVTGAGEKLEDEYYTVTSRSTLSHQNEKYNIQIYGTDEKMEVGACVIKTKASGQFVHIELLPFVVKKIKTGVNADNELQTVIEGYRAGKLEKLVLANKKIDADDVFSLYSSYNFGNTKFDLTNDIKKGDVIQYVTNARGEVDNIRMLFSPLREGADILYSEKFMPAGNNEPLSESNNYGYIYTGYGTVKNVYTGRFAQQTQNGWIRNVPVKDSNVYVWDGRTLEQGSSSDVRLGRKVFVHARYASTMMIVVVLD